MTDFSPEVRKAFAEFHRPLAEDAAGDALMAYATSALFAYLAADNLWRGNGFAAACLLGAVAFFAAWGRKEWRRHRRLNETVRQYERQP